MCYSDGKNSKEAEACMTWNEYTAAAYKTLSYSENDIGDALRRAAEAAPDKEDYTSRDLQVLELSIRLRAMYQSPVEQRE